MKTIVKMKFGSHLYGTSTPASDLDFKGIYLPTDQEIATGRYPKCIEQNTKSSSSENKNTSEDIDSSFYSLQYFIELACQGETVALDMLHAPANMLLESTGIWLAIRNNRARFYTRNLNSFVGYARSQAAKYGIKGSRLNAVREAVEVLMALPPNDVLEDVWDKLPEGEHIHKEPLKLGDPMKQHRPISMYTICGKQLQSTAKVKFVLPTLVKFQEQYGTRAKLAAVNESIDWKAVSHALRACFQVREILTTGDLVFPLTQAPYLLQVKQGLLDYKSEVGPRLEHEMEELEHIAAASKLPEKADREYWDDFLYGCYFRVGY